MVSQQGTRVACVSPANFLGMQATESSAGECCDYIQRVRISSPCPAKKKRCSSNYEPVAAGKLHLAFLLARAPGHFASCRHKKLFLSQNGEQSGKLGPCIFFAAVTHIWLEGLLMAAAHTCNQQCSARGASTCPTTCLVAWRVTDNDCRPVAKLQEETQH